MNRDDVQRPRNRRGTAVNDSRKSQAKKGKATLIYPDGFFQSKREHKQTNMVLRSEFVDGIGARASRITYPWQSGGTSSSKEYDGGLLYDETDDYMKYTSPQDLNRRKKGPHKSSKDVASGFNNVKQEFCGTGGHRREYIFEYGHESKDRDDSKKKRTDDLSLIPDFRPWCPGRSPVEQARRPEEEAQGNGEGQKEYD